MIPILLQQHDQTQVVKRVTCTEILLPESLEYQRRYYRLSGSKMVLLKDKDGSKKWHELPFYRQCRGCKLTDILFTPAKD